ncbi:UNKNOWN [Stylonychia lemnae]|uniref:Uncharacterized protein n=1 Tax=Stylonychia lemnae TaxID=5949 RepID=A0A078A557_STYLE|nr:UNKNOWN [Stylonychia lemnae]|eukprot:CDW75874.1 UNKNOWN [Stylonychia lemnae]
MQNTNFQEDSNIKLRLTQNEPTSSRSIINAHQQLPPTQNQQHMPKLKFAITGMNCELPAALSQRRNSALQSLFATTTSIGSALNSARGGNLNLTQGITDANGAQVNLESTQELKAFATVDMAKINKDRSYQLKLALEDNMREKEKEFGDTKNTYQQYRDEYERISKKFTDKNSELENEQNKQKQVLINLKEQLREIDREYKQSLGEYQEFSKINVTKIEEYQAKIDSSSKALKKFEDELQALNAQKKGYQMGADMQKKVRIQELDMKIMPIKDEKEKVELHLEMLKENMRMLIEVKSQNENERMMIQEDLTVSESNKMELVFQREELEGYMEKIKYENCDLRFIAEQNLDLKDWDIIIERLIDDKQKTLLLDLIRELQQYILGMSSGTTDNSVMQSDELEELEYLINKGKIQLSQAVDIIVEFAQRKMKLELSPDSLFEKLNQVSQNIDIDSIKEGLNSLEEIERQMHKLDSKIKVTYNRCQNELKPRYKALNLSEQNFSDQILKAESTITELQEYLNEIVKEIDRIQQEFDDTYQPNNEEYQDIEIKIQSLQEKIQEIEYQIDNYKQELQQNELNKIDAINEKSMRSTEFEQFQQYYDQITNQLKEEIRKERQMQNEGFCNPAIEELSVLVAQLKCDKESASKRLKYIQTKLTNAEESVQHAKQVLDNHILQAQQDQLNHKVQAPINFQIKRNISSAGAHGGSHAQTIFGPTQNTRITNIQQKAQTLTHGQVLSPTREESRFESRRGTSAQKDRMITPQIFNENERMHSHFIENPMNMSQTEMKKDPNRNYTSEIKQRHDQSDQSQVKKDKSTIDMVRYYYESSSAMSSEDSMNNHYNQYAQSRNQVQQKHIPIQSLITPRDPLQEIQNIQLKQNQSVIEGQQLMSAKSSESMNQSVYQYERKNSVQYSNEQIASLSLYNNQNQHNNRNVRVALRQSNTSLDCKQQSRTVIMAQYGSFKENITPNSLSNLNDSKSSFNMRKYSQATNVSQISNQSILQTIQTINGQTRPPAVPQSKQYLTSQTNIEQTPRGSSHKPKIQTTTKTSTNSRNNSKDGFQTQQKPVQTKMRLHVNVNNTGRAIQSGVVDLSKCQQSQKDIQFFESIKPLVEGAQFLTQRDGQFVLKQFYIDFSLMRMFMVNFNGEKEILMIENILKPELPQSTLDQIRQEKNQSPGKQGVIMNQGKRYEYNLIVNIGGNLERMQILAMSYEELRLWIVGINALIQYKSSLMRLSSQIISQ